MSTKLWFEYLVLQKLYDEIMNIDILLNWWFNIWVRFDISTQDKRLQVINNEG